MIRVGKNIEYSVHGFVPHLIPLTVEMQVRIPIDALDIIAVNQEVLKNHIKRLENRILIHDEAL